MNLIRIFPGPGSECLLLIQRSWLLSSASPPASRGPENSNVSGFSQHIRGVFWEAVGALNEIVYVSHFHSRIRE